jgi:hypothetical protein
MPRQEILSMLRDLDPIEKTKAFRQPACHARHEGAGIVAREAHLLNTEVRGYP